MKKWINQCKHYLSIFTTLTPTDTKKPYCHILLRFCQVTSNINSLETQKRHFESFIRLKITKNNMLKFLFKILLNFNHKGEYWTQNMFYLSQNNVMLFIVSDGHIQKSGSTSNGNCLTKSYSSTGWITILVIISYDLYPFLL